MLKNSSFSFSLWSVVLLACAAIPFSAQTSQPAKPAAGPIAAKEPTPGDLLRGAYGPYRANNDLLFYHLDLRVEAADAEPQHEFRGFLSLHPSSTS